jgi:hypothetical protein
VQLVLHVIYTGKLVAVWPGTPSPTVHVDPFA